MTPESPELSVVIPAYNEERRLPRSLPRVFDYLASRNLDGEVIVVDDGSADATAKVVQLFSTRHPGLRLISNERNRGKGFSVRAGVLAARGRFVLLTDADLSAPIEEADKLLDALRDFDVAIGSRALDRSLIMHHQPWWRELAGIAFNKTVKLLSGLPFEDTQCGFKAFRREPTRIVFEQQRIERYGFDPEILFLARRHGLRIVEIPVRWAHDPDSRVRVLRDGLRMLADLVRVRINALAGRYPRTGKEAASLNFI
jgi:glycosyltransferase involved in cell wall biosynthesis